MKLKEFIQNSEKYNNKEDLNIILQKYNVVIKKIVNKYHEYYKNKEYAKPFLDKLNK